MELLDSQDPVVKREKWDQAERLALRDEKDQLDPVDLMDRVAQQELPEQAVYPVHKELPDKQGHEESLDILVFVEMQVHVVHPDLKVKVELLVQLVLEVKPGFKVWLDQSEPQV